MCAVVLPSSIVPQALAAANAAATVQVPLPGDDSAASSGGTSASGLATAPAPDVGGGAPGGAAGGSTAAPAASAPPADAGTGSSLVTQGPNYEVLPADHPLTAFADAISNSIGAPSTHFHYTPGPPGSPDILTPSDPGVSAVAAAQGTPAGFQVPASGTGPPAPVGRPFTPDGVYGGGGVAPAGRNAAGEAVIPGGPSDVTGPYVNGINKYGSFDGGLSTNGGPVGSGIDALQAWQQPVAARTSADFNPGSWEAQHPEFFQQRGPPATGGVLSDGSTGQQQMANSNAARAAAGMSSL